METPVSIPSPSRANKQRDEPALERRNQVGGLAHGLFLLPANGPIQSRVRPHWLITLDDTVNVITTAIQFRHIVMAVTFQLAMVRSLKSCCRCRSRGRISANGMVRPCSCPASDKLGRVAQARSAMPATTSVTAFRQACKNPSPYRRSKTRHQKRRLGDGRPKTALPSSSPHTEN